MNPTRLLPRLAVLAVLLCALAVLLSACSAKPRADVGVGWRSTDDLTGPALSVGAGEWTLAEPFDGASLDACAGGRCATPAAPSSELLGRLAALDEAAARSRAQLAALDEKVAAGTLTAAQADAVRAAAADAGKAEAKAREAVAEATRAAAVAAEADRRSKSPPPVPTDWTPAGLATFALGLVGWFVNRRRAEHARAEAARAKSEAEARARQLADEAVARYDAAPFDLSDARQLAALQRAAAAPPA